MSTRTNDWVAAIEGLPDNYFRDLVNSLSMGDLQKYPPRKACGIPFGHEIGIFLRYLRRENNIFDPSALWYIYRSCASKRENLLRRAFLEGLFLSKEEWYEIIGEVNFSIWASAGILLVDADGKLACPFSILPIGKLLMITDSHNYNPEDQQSLNMSVWICKYTIAIMRFLFKQQLSKGRRYLDIGTGSGILLLSLRDRYKDGIGIDINARAIRIAAINVAINPGPSCSVRLADVFKLENEYGQFDLITWNIPFVFLPDSLKEKIDSYGGEMGIELTTRFIKILPNLLTDIGEAHLLSSAPILENGINVLESKLREIVKNLPLDISINVLTSYFMPQMFRFHKTHGIERFESVMLKIKIGKGRLERIEIPIARRVLDKISILFYRVQRRIFKQ